MLSEPLTLYKLMILYMLRQAKFPLSGSQISEFFLDKEYTTYFTLQQALNELLEAHLVKQEVIRNSSRYEITREGEETLGFFGQTISEASVEDIDLFIRNEVGIVSDYYRATNQEYVVQCEVREGKQPLIKVEVSVPTKDQAEVVCDNWRESNQQIYAYIMKELLKD